MKALTIVTATLSAVAVGVLMAGCDVAARFEDVSSRAPYSDYVGGVFELRVRMHISGVNAPPGYEKTVDYYVVKPASPSWSGPELITRETLPVGTLVEVEAVQRCTNCFLDFGDRLKAKIRIRGYSPQSDCPIEVPLEYLAPEFVRKSSKPSEPAQTTTAGQNR